MAPKRKTSLHLSVAPSVAVLSDQATFEAAVLALAGREPAFVATLLGKGPAPALRRREPGFEGLASIIVAQQVSTASANAIFSRLKARLGPLEAAALLATEDAELKLCGLSAPKLRTLRAIAVAIVDGTLDLATLAVTEAEAAHQALIAIKGIGPWTADVFLLFCLGHADAWPAGDLALQEAARLALNLPARPTTKELMTLGERWRPLRGVAAHCLWSYYGSARQRTTTLEESPRASGTQKLEATPRPKTPRPKTPRPKTPRPKIPRSKIPRSTNWKA